MAAYLNTLDTGQTGDIGLLPGAHHVVVNQNYAVPGSSASNQGANGVTTSGHSRSSHNRHPRSLGDKRDHLAI